MDGRTGERQTVTLQLDSVSVTTWNVRYNAMKLFVIKVCHVDRLCYVLYGLLGINTSLTFRPD